MNKKELEKMCHEARHLMVEALIRAGCGHPGGAFSSIDLLIALYFRILRIDPQNPGWEERDRFILSKGHSSVALYTALHLRGFISRAELLSFRQDGSILGGHPDMRKVPGVEMSTGSLGHGLPVGVGLAMAAKLDRRPFRTFVLVGDGESQEGSIWEAAMAAAHYKLDNLTAMLDRNRLQIDGCTEKVMALEPVRQKWEAFGWEVREIDGHNLDEIVDTLQKIPFAAGKPSMIIVKTIKGKGLSFMEDRYEWHGKALKDEYIDMARQEMKRLRECENG